MHRHSRIALKKLIKPDREPAQVELVQRALDTDDLLPELLAFTGVGDLVELTQPFQVVLEGGVAVHDAPQPGGLLTYLAGVVSVAPERGIVQYGFEFGQSRAFASDVKDTPGGYRGVASLMADPDYS